MQLSILTRKKKGKQILKHTFIPPFPIKQEYIFKKRKEK